MIVANREATFIALVAAMTGVSLKVVGQAENAAQYLNTFTQLSNQKPGNLAADALLYIFDLESKIRSPDVAAGLLLAGKFNGAWNNPTCTLSDVARSLLKLTLLGVWYDPTNPADEGIIPTPASYASGLVWLIGQAHPEAASTLAYGHWANPPPTLKSLIG